MPFVRRLWDKFLEFDKGLHAKLSRHYPKAIPTIDRWITAVVDRFLSNPVLAVVLAFVALILGVAGVRPLVLVSAGIGWFVCFLWAARSKALQELTVIARLCASVLIGSVLALGFWGLGNWALTQHAKEEEGSTPKNMPQATSPEPSPQAAPAPSQPSNVPQGNQNPPPQPGVPHTADKSAKLQGPDREGTTNANPLDLVDFNPFKGGSIYNKTSRQIYVLGITTTVRSLGGDESRSIPLDFEIPAHDTKSSFPNEETGQWSTLDYQTADWLNAWSNAYATYKQCAHPIVMLPSGIQLAQLREHYRTENKPLPVGDAEAKIIYRIGGETRDEVLPMKAVIFVQNGCVPQSPTPQESPKPTQPVAPVMLTAEFINPQAPSIIIYNPSGDVVEHVNWAMVVFRTLDLSFYSFTTQTIDYIKTNSQSANYFMDLATMPKNIEGGDGHPLTDGEELTGSVSIDCPRCSINTYVIHLVWKRSGWYFESESKGAYLLPRDMSTSGRKAYIELLTSDQFASKRIEIKPQ
jgi:hypothetical protein